MENKKLDIESQLECKNQPLPQLSELQKQRLEEKVMAQVGKMPSNPVVSFAYGKWVALLVLGLGALLLVKLALIEKEVPNKNELSDASQMMKTAPKTEVVKQEVPPAIVLPLNNPMQKEIVVLGNLTKTAIRSLLEDFHEPFVNLDQKSKEVN